MSSHLATKLQLRPGQRILVFNAPVGYLENLAPLPEGAQIIAQGPADVVHIFVTTGAELAQLVSAALEALRPDGMLWASYPKGGSEIATDLNRDAGWQPLTAAGWQGVRQIAVDATWSAVRFKQSDARTPAEMTARHFAGAKADLEPVYARIVAAVQTLGPDVVIGPRETYIAFGRGRQFAAVRTTTRPPRLELGLRLPEHPTTLRLIEAGKNFGSQAVTHKVAFTTPGEVDSEVLGWLAAAYAAA